MLLSPNYLFSYTPGGKMLGPQKFFGRVIAKTARVNSLLLIEVHEEIYFWLDFEVIKEQVDIINIIVYLLRDLNPIHFWSNIAFGPLTSTDKNLDHKKKQNKNGGGVPRIKCFKITFGKCSHDTTMSPVFTNHRNHWLRVTHSRKSPLESRSQATIFTCGANACMQIISQ